MKRLFALILVGLLCLTTAFAAEWREGLGPDQPMPGIPKLDLTREMGHMLLYPGAKLPTHHFCDVLEIYLPREDLALGEGHAHLYDENGEVADIDFANPDQVELRPLEESELASVRWGSGMCIEMHLPISLKIDGSYYVLMDLNCFTAANGTVSNYDLTQPNQWTPLLTGDYGISGLYYAEAPAQPTEEELEQMEEEPEETEAPEETAVEPKLKYEVGDVFTFELVLGGDAKTGVLFSENDSAYFEQMEFDTTTTVTGTVTKADLSWGVVFLDENGNPLTDSNGATVTVRPAWVDLSAPAEAPEG